VRDQGGHTESNEVVASGTWDTGLYGRGSRVSAGLKNVKKKRDGPGEEPEVQTAELNVEKRTVTLLSSGRPSKTELKERKHREGNKREKRTSPPTPKKNVGSSIESIDHRRAENKSSSPFTYRTKNTN